MGGLMDFQNTVGELEKRLSDLTALAKDSGIDLSHEIDNIKEKMNQKTNEIYDNISRWQRLELARLKGRPTFLDYVHLIFEDFIELCGDRKFGDDKAVVGGIALLDGQPVTVIGQQKGRDTRENIDRNFGMPHPEGYRKALRHMNLANKFGRPIICFIDTPGAYPGIEAEERGQGEAIAENLFQMSALEVPILSIVIGEGGSGGALALGVSNVIMMLENAVYSVISPEGFASIIFKDSSRAKEAVDILKPTAQDLLKLGIIDKIIKEPSGGAHKDIKTAALNIKSEIMVELSGLNNLSNVELVAHRYKKFRDIGFYKEISI
jgi:acetyl-CoA carboxylase carboxyl transferase subunit alpha